MTADTGVRYCVVRNGEEQYSVWPTSRAMAPGWWPQGFEGSREECLAHIDNVWTDMRPRSVRDHDASR